MEPILSLVGTASGTLVILDLHPALEPAPAPEPAPALKPEDHATELEQVQPCTKHVAECELQYQASWKDKSPSSPSAMQEPHTEQLETTCSTGQSRQAEQHPQHQPCAVNQGNQVQECWQKQGLETTETIRPQVPLAGAGGAAHGGSSGTCHNAGPSACPCGL